MSSVIMPSRKGLIPAKEGLILSTADGGQVTNVSAIAQALKPFRDWTVPRRRDEEQVFMACHVDAVAASLDEIEAARSVGLAPAEAVDFWSICRSARLCEDIEAPHWGLSLHSPMESVELTQELSDLWLDSYRPGDLAIGKFIGDFDCLMISPSEPPGRRMLIALEMDSRSEWPSVGSDMADFLIRYYKEWGDKWWDS